MQQLRAIHRRREVQRGEASAVAEVSFDVARVTTPDQGRLRPEADGQVQKGMTGPTPEEEGNEGEGDWINLHLALDAVGGKDVRSGLGAIDPLASWLTEREAELVTRARREGWTWQQLAEPLGRKCQSVWEKHRAIEEGEHK
jgi:hypothetical protein